MPYKVIVVEDDPMVASIDQRYVEMTEDFRAVQSFENGVRALEYLRKNPVDLIILDFYMPRMNGGEFIDAMKTLPELERMPSVIMVTSANDADTVSSLLRKGVVDYLVKPFTYDRFEEALKRFAAMRELLETSQGGMAQKQIDFLFKTTVSEKSSAQLDKGLNNATLDKIRSFLKENKGITLNSEQIAKGVALSRITVRRYVNYLVDTGELSSRIDYHTGGRPGIHYKFDG